MSAIVRVAGLKLKIDDNLEWSVVERVAVVATLEDVVLRLLRRHYGIEWTPAFGLYEPDMANAIATAVVEDFDAELLEVNPPPLLLEPGLRY